MRIDKPKRKHRATKRLDLTDITHVLRDRRTWGTIGVVTAPVDGSDYWRVVMSDDGSAAVDIMVHVVTQPHGEPMECRLAAGMFIVPALDEEVAVLIPSGRRDFMPTIVAILSSNVVPTTQGPTPERIVIVRGEVVVHDGSGGASELALKSDVAAIKTAISGAAVTAEDGGATLKANIVAALNALVPPWPVGTRVLKAK